jgi:hypothetical protein
MANNENIVLDYFLNGMELFLNNRKKSDNLPCVTKQGLEHACRMWTGNKLLQHSRI